MATPQFTIVIPMYRSTKVLQDTLAALDTLNTSAWECILVDDGSPDNTVDVAISLTRHDSRFNVIGLPDAHGSACPARNIGAANAHPESRYILFLDHDDLLHPDALTHMRHLLDQHPNHAAVHGTALLYQATDPDYRLGAERRIYRNRRIELLHPDEETTFESMATLPHIPAPGTVLCRLSDKIRSGLFPDGRLGQLDYDGWLRLLIDGNFIFSPHPVLTKRHIGGNMIGNLRNVRKRILNTRIRTSQRPELSPSQRRYLFTAGAANELFESRQLMQSAIHKAKPLQLLQVIGRIEMAARLVAHCMGTKRLACNVQMQRPTHRES